MPCAVVTPDQAQYTPQANSVEWKWCKATDGNWYIGAYVDDTLVASIRGFSQMGYPLESYVFVAATPK